MFIKHHRYYISIGVAHFSYMFPQYLNTDYVVFWPRLFCSSIMCHQNDGFCWHISHLARSRLFSPDVKCASRIHNVLEYSCTPYPCSKIGSVQEYYVKRFVDFKCRLDSYMNTILFWLQAYELPQAAIHSRSETLETKHDQVVGRHSYQSSVFQTI